MTSERKYPDMWVDPEDDPREAESNASGEKAVLAGYLDRYRKTLEMKCDGLDAEQLARRSVPPSTMSLLGWCGTWRRSSTAGSSASSRARTSPGCSARTRTATPTSTARVADPAVVEEAFATWRAQVRAARGLLEGVDDLGATVDLDGDQVEVRDIVVHMVEEYARHCGHADLLRECIDGRTGQ